MIDVSVVIVTHNTLDLLIRCLTSILKKQHSVSHEIIVVDNGSSDNTYNLVLRDFPSIRIIRNEVSYGFSHGVNTGIKACKGRNIYILEADTELASEDPLAALANFLDANSNVAAVGPQLRLVRNGKIQRSAFVTFPSLATFFMEWSQLNVFLGWCFPSLGYPGKYYFTTRELTNSRKVGWVMGGIMMVKSEIIERVGMMDEGFYLLAEDTDWCRRMKNHGYEIWYHTGAVVNHHWGVNLTNVKHTIDCYAFGMRRYIQKHHGPTFLVAFYLITALCSLCSIIFLSLVVPIAKSRREFFEGSRAFSLGWLTHLLRVKPRQAAR